MNKGVRQLAIALIRKRLGNGRLSKEERKRAKAARKAKHQKPVEQTVGSTTSTALGPAANE